jgi:hypothetical protein
MTAKEARELSLKNKLTFEDAMSKIKNLAKNGFLSCAFDSIPDPIIKELKELGYKVEKYETIEGFKIEW